MTRTAKITEMIRTTGLYEAHCSQPTGPIEVGSASQLPTAPLPNRPRSGWAGQPPPDCQPPVVPPHNWQALIAGSS